MRIYFWGQESYERFHQLRIPTKDLFITARLYCLFKYGIEIDSESTRFGSRCKVKKYVCKCSTCQHQSVKEKWSIDFMRDTTEDLWRLSSTPDESHKQLCSITGNLKYTTNSAIDLANYPPFQHHVKEVLQLYTGVKPPTNPTLMNTFLNNHTEVSLETSSANSAKTKNGTYTKAKNAVQRHLDQEVLLSIPPKYEAMPAYLEELHKNNSGVTVVLQNDSEGRFYRLFIGFPIARKPYFGVLTKPLFVTDCTFSKSAFYTGTFFNLCTYAFDGSIIPLAFAIIPGESTVHLSWVVLLCFRHGIPLDRHAIFSDQGPLLGTLRSIRYHLGIQFHLQICLEHFIRNIRDQFKGLVPKELKRNGSRSRHRKKNNDIFSHLSPNFLRESVENLSDSPTQKDFFNRLDEMAIILLETHANANNGLVPDVFRLLEYILKRHPRTWTVFGNAPFFNEEEYETRLAKLQNEYKLLHTLSRRAKDKKEFGRHEANAMMWTSYRTSGQVTLQYEFVDMIDRSCLRYGVKRTNISESIAAKLNTIGARKSIPPDAIKHLIDYYNDCSKGLVGKLRDGQTNNDVYTGSGLELSTFRSKIVPEAFEPIGVENGNFFTRVMFRSLSMPRAQHKCTLTWGDNDGTTVFNTACDNPSHVELTTMHNTYCACMEAVLNKAKENVHWPLDDRTGLVDLKLFPKHCVMAECTRVNLESLRIQTPTENEATTHQYGSCYGIVSPPPPPRDKKRNEYRIRSKGEEYYPHAERGRGGSVRKGRDSFLPMSGVKHRKIHDIVGRDPGKAILTGSQLDDIEKLCRKKEKLVADEESADGETSVDNSKYGARGAFVVELLSKQTEETGPYVPWTEEQPHETQYTYKDVLDASHLSFEVKCLSDERIQPSYWKTPISCTAPLMCPSTFLKYVTCAIPAYESMLAEVYKEVFIPNGQIELFVDREPTQNQDQQQQLMSQDHSVMTSSGLGLTQYFDENEPWMSGWENDDFEEDIVDNMAKGKAERDVTSLTAFLGYKGDDPIVIKYKNCFNSILGRLRNSVSDLTAFKFERRHREIPKSPPALSKDQETYLCESTTTALRERIGLKLLLANMPKDLPMAVFGLDVLDALESGSGNAINENITDSRLLLLPMVRNVSANEVAYSAISIDTENRLCTLYDGLTVSNAEHKENCEPILNIFQQKLREETGDDNLELAFEVVSTSVVNDVRDSLLYCAAMFALVSRLHFEPEKLKYGISEFNDYFIRPWYLLLLRASMDISILLGINMTIPKPERWDEGGEEKADMNQNDKAAPKTVRDCRGLDVRLQDTSIGHGYFSASELRAWLYWHGIRFKSAQNKSELLVIARYLRNDTERYEYVLRRAELTCYKVVTPCSFQQLNNLRKNDPNDKKVLQRFKGNFSNVDTLTQYRKDEAGFLCAHGNECLFSNRRLTQERLTLGEVCEECEKPLHRLCGTSDRLCRSCSGEAFRRSCIGAARKVATAKKVPPAKGDSIPEQVSKASARGIKHGEGISDLDDFEDDLDDSEDDLDGSGDTHLKDDTKGTSDSDDSVKIPFKSNEVTFNSRFPPNSPSLTKKRALQVSCKSAVSPSKKIHGHVSTPPSLIKKARLTPTPRKRPPFALKDKEVPIEDLLKPKKDEGGHKKKYTVEGKKVSYEELRKMQLPVKYTDEDGRVCRMTRNSTLIAAEECEKESKNRKVKGRCLSSKDGHFLNGKYEDDILFTYPCSPEYHSDLTSVGEGLDELSWIFEQPLCSPEQVEYIDIPAKTYKVLNPEPPLAWATHNVIDFLISLIEVRTQNSGVLLLRTDLYAYLRQGPSLASTRTSNRNINIFEKRLIMFPINTPGHWSFCVIVNPGAIQEKRGGVDALLPCIIYLNSVRTGRTTKLHRMILEWLNHEWGILKPKEVTQCPFNTESFKLYKPDCSQQTNQTECGFFVCKWLLAFSRMGNIRFTHKDAGLCTNAVDDSEAFRDLITSSELFICDDSVTDRLRRNMRILIERIYKVLNKDG